MQCNAMEWNGMTDVKITTFFRLYTWLQDFAEILLLLLLLI